MYRRKCHPEKCLSTSPPSLCLAQICILWMTTLESTIKRRALPLWNVTWNLSITRSPARRKRTMFGIAPAAEPLTANTIPWTISPVHFEFPLTDEESECMTTITKRMTLRQSHYRVHAGALEVITPAIEVPQQNQVQSTDLRETFPQSSLKTGRSGTGNSIYQVVSAKARTGEITKGDESSRSRGVTGHGSRRQSPVVPGSS